MEFSNQKTLVLISSIVAQFEQAMHDTEGELLPEHFSMLDVKENELAPKIDDYKFAHDRFEMNADYCRAKAAQWAKIARGFETAQERIKDNIKQAMKIMNVTELVGNETRFVLSATKPRLVIDDETKIPSIYKVQIVSTSIEKDRVRGDLEMGLTVDGARFEHGVSLRSYAAISAASKKKAVKASVTA
jgi:hypothetical protein